MQGFSCSCYSDNMKRVYDLVQCKKSSHQQFYKAFNDNVPFIKDARFCLVIPHHTADINFLLHNFSQTMHDCGLLFMYPEVMVALYCMAEVPIMLCPNNASRLVFRAVFNGTYYKTEIVNNQISSTYGVMELCAKSVCPH